MSFSVGQPEQSGLDLILQGLGAGAGIGLQQSLADFHKKQQLEFESKKFEKQGYPKDLALLAAGATTGGQTEILKQLLEMRQRGDIFGQKEQPIESDQELKKEDLGLTQREKIKREEGRFAKQSEKYGELSEKSAKLDQEQMRLQRLQELNETGNLPTGLKRINVNLKSGELVVPFAASPDAQEFTKIVNDFLVGAKDTFGSRVTNFEVNRFLRRLPSLLNTEEGRRRVLRQMEIINQINGLHNQSILDEFDSRGGIRKVDFDVAERSARKKIDNQIKQLQKEYVSGSSQEKKEKSLSQETALEILREAKGNKTLARKIAKQRGYDL